MYSVLLIDDDGKLADVLTDYCAQFDIRIEPALRPSIGLEKLGSSEFDAVILDVMMPEMDGFEVCKRIRRSSDIPIIMLTARGDVTDRIVGLELGADDYLPKLLLLADSAGTAFTRDEILAELKGTDNELFSRSVDILVSRLRAKLKPMNPIRTIHGAGYSFAASRKDPPS